MSGLEPVPKHPQHDSVTDKTKDLHAPQTHDAATWGGREVVQSSDPSRISRATEHAAHSVLGKSPPPPSKSQIIEKSVVMQPQEPTDEFEFSDVEKDDTPKEAPLKLFSFRPGETPQLFESVDLEGQDSVAMQPQQPVDEFEFPDFERDDTPEGAPLKLFSFRPGETPQLFESADLEGQDFDEAYTLESEDPQKQELELLEMENSLSAPPIPTEDEFDFPETGEDLGTSPTPKDQ